MVSKRAFIRMYKVMDKHMYVRGTKTIIFDQGVQKYTRVTATVIFDQFYVTEHNFIKTDRIGVGN